MFIMSKIIQLNMIVVLNLMCNFEALVNGEKFQSFL